MPISNEEYSEVILKKSEIEDLENYLWFFTKNWPSIYEIEDEEGNIQLQIVGETVIYDKMTSQYRIILKDKKEASKCYKLIKALFILAYDLRKDYQFQIKIGENGGLEFYYNDEKIEYDTLPEFLKKESISKIKENERVKTETKEVKADIKDLQKQEEQKNLEYLRKEKEIVTFLECKKTFMGRIKYFFKERKVRKTKTFRNILQVKKD